MWKSCAGICPSRDSNPGMVEARACASKVTFPSEIDVEIVGFFVPAVARGWAFRRELGEPNVGKHPRLGVLWKIIGLLKMKVWNWAVTFLVKVKARTVHCRNRTFKWIGRHYLMPCRTESAREASESAWRRRNGVQMETQETDQERISLFGSLSVIKNLKKNVLPGGTTTDLSYHHFKIKVLINL